MVTVTVFSFDAEGRPVEYESWLEGLHLSLHSVTKDDVESIKAPYDAVDKRYSPPSFATLGHRALPFLFSELSDFTTVPYLMTHLHSLGTCYRATLKPEFLAKNQPLYHFLSLDPTKLTLALFETCLLKAETSARTVAASRGTPNPSFFERCIGAVPAYAFLTFTMDSGATRCFFRDCRTVTSLPELDMMVTTTTPRPECVAIYMDKIGDHLATFTRRPGSGLYTLQTESAHVAASGQVATPCSCRSRTSPSSCTTVLVTPTFSVFVACTRVALSLASRSRCPHSRHRLHCCALRASRGGNVPLITPPCFLRPLLPFRRRTWTPAEGGGTAADDTVASRRSLHLETPPGFPPWPSSTTLQPVDVNLGAIGGVGSGSAGSRGVEPGVAGSGGADPWGAVPGGAERPCVGGVEGTAAGGSTSSLQPLPREQHDSSLPLPESVAGGFVNVVSD
ncbi:unnamed protein product [Closterium sp. NIES-54]